MRTSKQLSDDAEAVGLDAGAVVLHDVAVAQALQRLHLQAPRAAQQPGLKTPSRTRVACKLLLASTAILQQVLSTAILSASEAVQYTEFLPACHAHSC